MGAEQAPPWHQTVLARTEAAIAADRLPHAIIVAGPPGWDQAGLACRIAERLLDQPAGRVDATFAHADFRWLKRELNSSGSKLSQVIAVDQIRAVQTFLNTATGTGRRKLLVINEAHRLNREAANALLKTLEEPAPETHVLLITDAAGRLLPTIRSRCQTWPVEVAAPAVVKQWLIDHGADADQVDAAVFEHGGAPERALAAAAEEAPMEPVLAALRRGSTIASVVDALKDQPLDSLTARWGRYVVAALVGRGAFADLAPAELLSFNDELLATRRHVLTNNAPNQQLILERLCQLWRQIPAL